MIYLLRWWTRDDSSWSRVLDITPKEYILLETRLNELRCGFEDSNGSLTNYELTGISSDRSYKFYEIMTELNERFSTTKSIIAVYINGNEHYLPSGELSYEQLVELAGYKGTPTATYYHNHHGGSLYKSKAVKLEDGMSFTVCHTNSA